MLEVNNYATNSKVYTIDKKPISDFKEVLSLLKFEIQSNPKEVNERVLRATRDISGIIAKQFEETSLEDAIFNLIEVLANEIPVVPRSMSNKK